MNIVNYLSRDDKHYLGGGNRLLWTPNFPQWLDRPGFWDKAHYYNLEIEPVFTVTLLDGKGDEFNLKLKQRRWFPSHIRNIYHNTNGFEIVEEKTLFENDVLSSNISLTNTGLEEITIDLILWNLHKGTIDSSRISNIEFGKFGIHYTRNINFRQLVEYDVECFLGMRSGVDDMGVYLSDNTSLTPEWKYTPFYEKFDGKLKGGLNPENLNSVESSMLYLAVHSRIVFRAGEHKNLMFLFSASNNREETRNSVMQVSTIKHPVVHNLNIWGNYFNGLPEFTCSDKFIEKYYWYRWFGLKLNTLCENDFSNMKYPAVTEGPAYFRGFISYSAQCHIMETRWMKDPTLAQGTVLNFINTQRENGSFTGHIYPKYLQPESFYHSNWSRVLDIYFIHNDNEFLEKAYKGLKKYAAYFDRERDREDSGMYDILNHYETGQEYMSRYQAIDKNADRFNWGENFRLKGVDSTIYIYELKKALLEISIILGLDDDSNHWQEGIEKIRRSVLGNMWDSNAGMFFDVDPISGRKTGIKAAVCFYPYFTDIVLEEHLSGLKENLLDPGKFWTEYPVPSSSVDDPMFSEYGDWKGKRLVCPWNGRVWPMTNSHIAEALAGSAIMFNDKELRKKAAEFITKFIKMMFIESDMERPNCYEHYNPLNGKASVFRGIDDYQHSWVNDLIIKYICGIRPGKDKIIIDPFPFEVDSFKISNLQFRDLDITVMRNIDRYSVRIKSEIHSEKQIGEITEIIV